MKNKVLNLLKEPADNSSVALNFIIAEQNNNNNPKEDKQENLKKQMEKNKDIEGVIEKTGPVGLYNYYKDIL